MCWRTPITVTKGKQYRLRVAVDHPWKDSTISTSPLGFGSERFDWPLRWVAPLLRRSFSAPWFQPLVTVIDNDGKTGTMTSVRMKLLDPERRLYSGEFRAPASGKLVLAVNDAVFLWYGKRDYFYRDERALNSGTASVRIDDCDDEAIAPCE